MVQQVSIMHAQMSANSANFGSRDSSAVIGAERASGNHSVAVQLNNSGSLTNHHNPHHLGIVAPTLQQQHHHSNSININRIHKNSISANNSSNNFPNNHHHHLGHNNNTGRNRLAGTSPTASSIASAAAAAAMALNSRFSHHVHPFATSTNSNSPNSNSHVHQHHHHHHHPLSLASSSNSSSSASSAASSPPSASISPSSLAPGTPPQSGNILGTNPTSSYLANNNHHYQSNMNQHNQNATNYSHLSSTQNISNTQQQQQNTSRYKTELCRPFEENGTCKYGEKCQFAHGMSELRTLTRHPKYKTEFCRTFHTTGFCPYGPRCHFIHNSKTPPTNQQTLSLGSYNNGPPFGHQTSHSASPSTSPISSASSATTTNGSSSLSSSASTASSSSSSSSSQRMLDAMTGFQYGSRLTTQGLFGGPIDPSNQLPNDLDQTSLTSPVKPLATTATAAASHQRRIENDEANPKGQATGCAKETQRLLWIHSQMNESSRWPPAMCASGLISNNTNSRRTWQMQA